MNAASWIVLGVVLALAVAAVCFSVHRRRKAGSSACCGCALHDVCCKNKR